MEKVGEFGNIVLGLLVCTAAVQIVYYFISKRDPSVSKFDKSLWLFMSLTCFYIILVFISYLQLSTVGTRTIVPISNERLEVAVQELAKNQEQLKLELEAFREVLSLLLLITGMYVMSALGILQQLRKRAKEVVATNYRDAAAGIRTEVAALSRSERGSACRCTHTIRRRVKRA